MSKVLICDDQIMIHETLSEYILAEGFTYVSAYDGQEAIEVFESETPDLIVLDLMMPKRNGMDVCRMIRQISNVPIIMLSAKGEEIDRILGLELGADDYIVKPFSPREVIARMKVVLRRMNDPFLNQEETLSFPGLQINLNRYEVKVNGHIIPFSPKEVELLHKLCASPGRVFDRETLLSSIWGYEYFGDTRVVDTQIKRIRQKLENHDSWCIRSIYGVGYKFEIHL